MTTDPAASELSFVVTPLRNASDDPGQSYVAEGLSDYLTADLSRIRGSFVIARASAAALAAAEPPAVAAEFGARYIISGSAATHDGRLQIELSLFDAQAGKTPWSGKIEGDLSALAALRRDVLTRVAQETGGQLGDLHALSRPGRDAGEGLLRARALLSGPQTAATVAEARHLLETVLKDGPSQDASDGLASIYLLEALSGRSPAPAQDLRRAKELIDTAIAADPGDARAQALRGAFLRLAKNPAGALAAYQAAVAADPNLADSYAEIGRVSVDLGRAGDAVPAIEKALALSPRDPQRALWMSFAGLAELYAGHPAAAVPWLEQSAAAQANFVNPRIWLAAAQQMAGSANKAAAAVTEALKLSVGLTVAHVARQLPTEDPAVRRRSEEILNALRRAGLPQ